MPAFNVPTPTRHVRSRMLAIVAATAIGFAACDTAAPPTPTRDLPASAAAPAPATGAAAAPVSTPRPEPPPGVPADAQPLLYGCADGVSRCQEISAGRYYTAGKWALLPGLTFTLPAGWSSAANEAGELELHRTGDDHNGIMIWRDVVPWRDGHAAVELALDPAAWIARLAADPCLHISVPERVVLGSWIDLRGGKQNDLQAITVSVGRAPDPGYGTASCPDTRIVEILVDPMHWENSPFSVGGDEMNDATCPCSAVQRLYFASIGYVQHKHLLVVALQSYGPNGSVDAQMASLQAAAQPVLDSLIAPAIVVDN